MGEIILHQIRNDLCRAGETTFIKIVIVYYQLCCDGYRRFSIFWVRADGNREQRESPCGQSLRKIAMTSV
jgi:hypothetical protein